MTIRLGVASWKNWFGGTEQCDVNPGMIRISKEYHQQYGDIHGICVAVFQWNTGCLRTEIPVDDDNSPDIFGIVPLQSSSNRRDRSCSMMLIQQP